MGSLLDVEKFLSSPDSGDHEAVQSFIASTIRALSMESRQYDPYPKGITLN